MSGMPLKGTVVIVHGMAEHSGNYGAFSEALQEAGYVAYMGDLLDLGTPDWDPETGWQRWVEQIQGWVSKARMDHPELPLFVFGHSMGSYLAQDVVASGVKANGLILSATSYESPGLLRFSAGLAWLLSGVFGRRSKGYLFYVLTFGVFNLMFFPARTPFDWLSRDTIFVDMYRADPRCGGVPTLGFYRAFFKGFAACYGKGPWTKVKTAVYAFSGTRDPLGKWTKSVLQLVNRYRKAGVTVETRFYPGGRHVMLWETNRLEVVQDLVRWLDQRINA